MKDRYDIVIAGAGPAGSATAIRLALAGLNVAIVEKAVFPRPKLCGEFISPECIEHLETLGVLPDVSLAGAVDIDRTVFYARGGRSLTVASDWFGMANRAIGLSRAALDDVLLQRVVDLGVDLINGVVNGLVFGKDGSVEGVKLKDSPSIRALVTIDATGRTRALARHAVGKRQPTRRPPHVAFKAHFEGTSLEPGACEIYSYRGGYGGCSSVEGDRSNLCFIADARDTRERGSDGDRMLNEVVFSNKRAQFVLGQAERVTDWIAVPVDKYGRHDPTPAPGLIAVGDAASFIDPFTGSGILLALQSAKVAADSVIGRTRDVAAISSAYEIGYASNFDSRFRISSLIRRAAFVPLVADATIAFLSMSQRLTRAVAGATRENKIDSLSASD
jgi:flavin-dependent dehydrogenase